MKKNIYTVPDGFFDKTEQKILERTDDIRKRRGALMLVCPLVIAVVALGISKPWQSDEPQVLASANTPAINYNCDIFLEIFEY